MSAVGRATIYPSPQGLGTDRGKREKRRRRGTSRLQQGVFCSARFPKRAPSFVVASLQIRTSDWPLPMWRRVFRPAPLPLHRRIFFRRHPERNMPTLLLHRSLPANGSACAAKDLSATSPLNHPTHFIDNLVPLFAQSKRYKSINVRVGARYIEPSAPLLTKPPSPPPAP